MRSSPLSLLCRSVAVVATLFVAITGAHGSAFVEKSLSASPCQYKSTTDVVGDVDTRTYKCTTNGLQQNFMYKVTHNQGATFKTLMSSGTDCATNKFPGLSLYFEAASCIHESVTECVMRGSTYPYVALGETEVCLIIWPQTGSTSDTFSVEIEFTDYLAHNVRNTGQQEEPDAPGVAYADMNVVTAWNKGFTGDGIHVQIVDDGLNINHEDFQSRVVTSSNRNFIEDGTNDPTPPAADQHGTGCGGVSAGGASDQKCGVGVAYDASLSGIRLIGGSGNLADFVTSLGSDTDNQVVDISNNSWGDSGCDSSADGCDFYSTSSGMHDALQDAVTLGRNGKGRVVLFAAGNEGEYGGDTNAYGLGKVREVITVAASTLTGKRAFYSNTCACLLVNAGSNGRHLETDPNPTRPALLAAGGDASNDSCQGFSGTSAATPAVAGAVALILEAKSTLTWRDVQHILVRTSYQNDKTSSSWEINGAGHHFSHHYGFGRVNAVAATELAQLWTASPTEVTTEDLAFHPSGTSVSFSNTGTVTKKYTVASAVTRIESVMIALSLTYTRIGHLQITLTSPAGTVANLVDKNSRHNENTLTLYPFYCRNFWDESAVGEWTLSFTDSEGSSSGSLTEARISFFGAASSVGPPSKPIIHSVSSSGGQVTVGWTAPKIRADIITTYTVSYALEDLTAGALVGNVHTVTSATTTGAVLELTLPDNDNLVGGLVYTYTVVANSASGDSPQATGVSALHASAPTTMAKPTVSTVSSTSVNVAFVLATTDALSGGSTVDLYTVIARDSGNNVIKTVTGTTTPLLVPDLTIAVDYTFTVNARNSIGTSADSTPSDTHRITVAPQAPTIDSVTNTASGTIVVDFTEPSGDAGTGGATLTGFTIKAEKSGFPTVEVTSTGATSVTLAGLTNGLQYTISVTATNSVGTSSAATTTFTPMGPPGTSVISNVNEGDAAAVITVTELTKGDLSEAAGNGGEITKYQITTSPATVTTEGVDASAINVGSLVNGVEYEFFVRLCNARFCSDSISGRASITRFVKDANGEDTTETEVVTRFTMRGKPNPPTDVVVSNFATLGSQATVTFKKPSVVTDGVTLSFSCVAQLNTTGDITNDGSALAELTDTGGTCTLTKLTNGANYFFTVQSVSTTTSDALDARSASVIIKGPPATPTVQPLVLSNGDLFVSWTMNTDLSDTGGEPLTHFKVSVHQIAANSTNADPVVTDHIVDPDTPRPMSLSTLLGKSLTYGDLYRVFVRAVNPIAESGSDQGQEKTAATLPGKVQWVLPGPIAQINATDFNVLPMTETGGSPIIGYRFVAIAGVLPYSFDYHPSTFNAAVPNLIRVPKLQNDNTYVFNVTAFNVAGHGPVHVSAAVTPMELTPPASPTIHSIVTKDGAATVNVDPPKDNGGAAIEKYTVLADPGSGSSLEGKTAELDCIKLPEVCKGVLVDDNGKPVANARRRLLANTLVIPIEVTGLKNGHSYNFVVRASNNQGLGPAGPAKVETVEEVAEESSTNLIAAIIVGVILFVVVVGTIILCLVHHKHKKKHQALHKAHVDLHAQHKELFKAHKDLHGDHKELRKAPVVHAQDHGKLKQDHDELVRLYANLVEHHDVLLQHHDDLVDEHHKLVHNVHGPETAKAVHAERKGVLRQFASAHNEHAGHKDKLVNAHQNQQQLAAAQAILGGAQAPKPAAASYAQQQAQQQWALQQAQQHQQLLQLQAQQQRQGGAVAGNGVAPLNYAAV